MPTQYETNPSIATLTGNLFEVKAAVFITDEDKVRIRLKIKNRAGSQAFYSVHGAIFNEFGLLIGSGGQNDVYHEKKKDEEYTEQ